MKYSTPFPRVDIEREKAATRHSEVITYKASPELAKELTERMMRKREEMLKERERKYHLSGSVARIQNFEI